MWRLAAAILEDWSERGGDSEARWLVRGFPRGTAPLSDWWRGRCQKLRSGERVYIPSQGEGATHSHPSSYCSLQLLLACSVLSDSFVKFLSDSTWKPLPLPCVPLAEQVLLEVELLVLDAMSRTRKSKCTCPSWRSLCRLCPRTDDSPNWKSFNTWSITSAICNTRWRATRISTKQQQQQQPWPPPPEPPPYPLPPPSPEPQPQVRDNPWGCWRPTPCPPHVPPNTCPRWVAFPKSCIYLSPLQTTYLPLLIYGSLQKLMSSLLTRAITV